MLGKGLMVELARIQFHSKIMFAMFSKEFLKASVDILALYVPVILLV